MTAKKRTWLVLALGCGCLLLLLAASAPSLVSHSVIQGTWHGSSKAFLPPSPEYELVSLRTTLGTKIIAQFGKAKGPKGELLADYSRCPTVIYCYPGGGTLRWSAPQFEGFRRLGLNVIMPEYPGFGLSDGRPSESGCYQAAESVYDYILSRKDLDPGSLIAAGWSVGGGAATDLACRHPLAGLILFGTSTKLSDIGHYVAANHPWLAWMPEWALERLTAEPKLDSVSKMPTVRCPILIVYGTKDPFVSKAMTEQLAAASKTRITVLPIDGAAHFDLFRAGGGRLWLSLAGWIVGACPQPG
jgi:hypothetical protein